MTIRNMSMNMLAIATLMYVVGCNEKLDVSTEPTQVATQENSSLIELGSDGLSEFVSTDGVSWRQVTDDKGEHHLSLHFNALEANKPTIRLGAESPWNMDFADNVAIVMDIENPTNIPVFLHVGVEDIDGVRHNRNVAVPPKTANSYYVMIKGINVDTNTGMRSNPKNWLTEYEQTIWRTGTRHINIEQVSALHFTLMGIMHDKHLIISNIRLEEPTTLDENVLVGIADGYGQNAKMDFENKVDNDAALVAQYQAESANLSGEVWDGRSQYGGWKQGPKLEATGFFRTEKYQGKWTLVDPEGYLFFSTGIANVRMANTSTITGYDVPESLVPARSSDDLTPEDSVGLNRVSLEAAEQRFVSSDTRANMFLDLPSYDEPLGNFFGYRREVHTGVIPKGETFSFYMANLSRKFETADMNEVLDKWETLTVDRMLDWGFTSFGNWIDTRFYDDARIPYFANGWIIGDFATVSTGNDYWSPIPDPFDPVFVQRADVTLAQVAAEVKNNPWCVGVFIDNEKSWGMMSSTAAQYGLVAGTLRLNADKSPAKRAFVAWLKSRFETVESLNSTWGQSFNSWSDVERGFEVDFDVAAALPDYSALLSLYADEYFKVVANAVDAHMPNHMYMGARFADWGMTPELRASSAKYADVVSYNYYREGLNEAFWTFLEDIDKPSIIGEFHIGAKDSGLFNPGLIGSHTQTLRGEMYQDYLYSVIDNRYFVGVHWFQYIDSPLTGRAYDGENYNVGFVSVTDIPYAPLIDAVKEVNRNLYSRRFNDTASATDNEKEVNE